MNESDPVSWFMIEPGWKVVDAEGDEVGRVEEVIGDSNADIFNGLSVTAGLLAGARYVPAETVGVITEGRVHLDLSHEQVHELDKYEHSPPSKEILPPDRER
jgi:uncharacterized protein YrrD